MHKINKDLGIDPPSSSSSSKTSSNNLPSGTHSQHDSIITEAENEDDSSHTDYLNKPAHSESNFKLSYPAKPKDRRLTIQDNPTHRISNGAKSNLNGSEVSKLQKVIDN